MLLWRYVQCPHYDITDQFPPVIYHVYFSTMSFLSVMVHALSVRWFPVITTLIMQWLTWFLKSIAPYTYMCCSSAGIVITEVHVYIIRVGTYGQGLHLDRFMGCLHWNVLQRLYCIYPPLNCSQCMYPICKYITRSVRQSWFKPYQQRPIWVDWTIPRPGSCRT